MAHDPNRFANEAAERSRQISQKNMDDLARTGHRPPGGGGGGGQKQGGLLGFVIVVALIAIAAFWIASMQS